jgi:hypothetical protein
VIVIVIGAAREAHRLPTSTLQAIAKDRTVVLDISSSVNMIAVTFERDPNAHHALTALRELDSHRQIRIRRAAVVARHRNVQIHDKDRGTESPRRNSDEWPRG